MKFMHYDTSTLKNMEDIQINYNYIVIMSIKHVSYRITKSISLCTLLNFEVHLNLHNDVSEILLVSNFCKLTDKYMNDNNKDKLSRNKMIHTCPLKYIFF